MMSRLSNEQIRILIYGVLMVLIAFDRTAIGAGLFLVLMGFIMAETKAEECARRERQS